MNIEATLNNAHVKEPCLVCGYVERPGDVAYFETKSGRWVCDECVEGGIEKMRDSLREAAVHYREVADRYESAAAGPIEIAEESEDVREERARVEAVNARETMRRQNRPQSDDLEDLPF
jgi:recombinational DNA repair protein (RecF pathway)